MLKTCQVIGINIWAAFFRALVVAYESCHTQCVLGAMALLHNIKWWNIIGVHLECFQSSVGSKNDIVYIWEKLQMFFVKISVVKPPLCVVRNGTKWNTCTLSTCTLSTCTLSTCTVSTCTVSATYCMDPDWKLSALLGKWQDPKVVSRNASMEDFLSLIIYLQEHHCWGHVSCAYD